MFIIFFISMQQLFADFLRGDESMWLFFLMTDKAVLFLEPLPW